jgi:murein DD-endopeptidase MepM/ murein hydrolase activator NlpD
MVAPGETIDSMARRYGVPAKALMEANGMTAHASLRAGQRIIIPHHRSGAPAAPAPTRAAANASAAPAVPAKATHATNAVDHVVIAGETLSSIARHYGTSRVALAKANGLSADSKIKIGQHIVVPGAKVAAAAPAAVQAPATKVLPAPVRSTIPPVAKPSGPASQKVASAEPAASAHVASPESVSEQGETTGSAPGFRWPVRGRIITGFGPKTNGQQNDGINLAVPEGTSVKAADDGIVAYAGNELKGYGNLLLVRHRNGFVTAYAHASELLVKRGDQIKRGQIIARSGQTGNVSSPQLHFEIRKGSSPVDPTQYLAGL